MSPWPLLGTSKVRNDLKKVFEMNSCTCVVSLKNYGYNIAMNVNVHSNCANESNWADSSSVQY